MNPRSNSRFFFVPLTLTLFGLSVWGVGGCGGGGRGENGNEGGEPLQILSIYPPSAAPGSTVSLCVTGMEEGEEPLFTVCNEPAATLLVQALEADITQDPNYEPCEEGTTEIFLTIPDICVQGDVEISAAVGEEQTQPITFQITTPAPDSPPPQTDPTPGAGQPPPVRGPTVPPPGSGTPRGPGDLTPPGGGTPPGGEIPPSGCQGDYGASGNVSRCADPLKPWCNTTNGNCYACRYWDSNGNEDCRPRTGDLDFCYQGTCVVCATDQNCRDANLGQRCTPERNCVQCLGLADCAAGQYCNEAHQCQQETIPAPEFFVSRDERDAEEEGAPEWSTTDLITDRLEYGQFKINTNRATEAYVYGDFGLEVIMPYLPCPEDGRVMTTARCGSRPQTAGTLWLRLDRVDGTEIKVVPRIFDKHEREEGEAEVLPAVSLRSSPFRRLDWHDGDLVECWPTAQPPDPNYCEGFNDYLEEHMPERHARDGALGPADPTDPYRLRQRVFRLKIPVNHQDFESKTLLFEMFKTDHRFVGVAKQGVLAAGTTHRLDPEEELVVPEVKIRRCEITPERNTPFLKVEMDIEHASLAGVHVDFPELIDPSTAMPRSIGGAVPLTDGKRTEPVYIPIKSPRAKVHCYAEGIDQKGALAYDVSIGHGGQVGRLVIDEDLSFWTAAFAEGVPAECTGADAKILKYNEVAADPDSDDNIGRCDAKVTWKFSQKVVVMPTEPQGSYIENWRPGTSPVPPNSCGTEAACKTPFAGEIKFAAYQDWDSMERVSGAVQTLRVMANLPPPTGQFTRRYRAAQVANARTIYQNEGECLYHLTSSDYTGGGIRIENPVTEFDTVLAGRSSCSRMEDVESSSGDSLWKRITRERTYTSKNVHQIWIRQFGETEADLPRAKTQPLDLRYYPELIVAPNSVIENPTVSDLSNQPMEHNWTVRIPFFTQHLVSAPTKELICWGEVQRCYQNGQRRDWAVNDFNGTCARNGGTGLGLEGWMEEIYPGEAVGIGNADISEDNPERYPQPWQVSTGEMPELDPSFYPQPGRDPMMSQGNRALATGSSFVNPQDAGASYYSYQGAFRVCRVQITATAPSGTSLPPRTIAIPSSSGLLNIPIPPEDPNETYYTNRHYYTEHSFGACSHDSQCANNCGLTGGELPCNECRSHTCKSRRFEPNGSP